MRIDGKNKIGCGLNMVGSVCEGDFAEGFVIAVRKSLFHNDTSLVFTTIVNELLKTERQSKQSTQFETGARKVDKF